MPPPGDPPSAAEPPKKRRLASDSSASDTDISSKIALTSIVKTKKKVRKLDSPPNSGSSLKNEEFRRIVAQSHYDIVSKSLATMEARKDPNYVPIYKQNPIVDSPKLDDPYSIPDFSPDKTRPKLGRHPLKREKPVMDLRKACLPPPTGASNGMATPFTPEKCDMQKRHNTSSPHPGAIFKNRKRWIDGLPKSSPTASLSPILDESDVLLPPVAFNRPSPLSSSRSCVQLRKQPDLVSTPVRIPGAGDAAKRTLRPSGMSTSVLGPRRPVEIDDQIQSTSEEGLFTSPVKKSIQKSKADGVETERRVLSRDSPLRRHRSNSTGSLIDVREGANDLISRSPSKKERGRSVERQATIIPSSRILRETPERARSRERFMRSASSGALDRLVDNRKLKQSVSMNNLVKQQERKEVAESVVSEETGSTLSSGPGTTSSHSSTRSPVTESDSWGSSIGNNNVALKPQDSMKEKEDDDDIFLSAESGSESSVWPKKSAVLQEFPDDYVSASETPLEAEDKNLTDDEVVASSQDPLPLQKEVKVAEPVLSEEDVSTISSGAGTTSSYSSTGISDEVVPSSQDPLPLQKEDKVEPVVLEGDLLTTSSRDGTTSSTVSPPVSPSKSTVPQDSPDGYVSASQTPLESADKDLSDEVVPSSQDSIHMISMPQPSSDALSKDIVPSSQDSLPPLKKEEVVETAVEEDNLTAFSSGPGTLSSASLPSPRQQNDDIVASSQDPPPSILPIPARQPSSVVILSDEDVVPCSQEIFLSQEVVECSQPIQKPQEAFSSQDVVPCSQEVVPSSQEVVSCSQEDLITDGTSSGECILQRAPPRSSLKIPGSSKRTNDSRVKFSDLNIYYFGRIQAFHVVPDHGDVAIGMEKRHFKERKMRILKTHQPAIGLDDPEESDLSEGEDPGFVDRFVKKVDFEVYQKDRQRLLQQNGVVVHKQKTELYLVRQSRKECGCSCAGGVCLPATCECHLSGIPCQVDRREADGRFFPCSCVNASLCQNENGHLFYDYDKVTQQRRNTIQLYKDMNKKGIYDSPRVKKFISDGEESDGEKRGKAELDTKTPTREDFLKGPRAQGTPAKKEKRRPKDGVPPSPKNFFPHSQSLL